MKKVPLAEILWRAANEHLPPSWSGAQTYSCIAAGMASGYSPHDWDAIKKCGAVKFLSSLGCPSNSLDCYADFYEYEPADSHVAPRQGVRYMWLLLAMHVAEDESILMEVSQ